MGYYPIGKFNYPFVYYRTLLDTEPHYENQSQEAIKLRNAMGQQAEFFLTHTELFSEGTSTHEAGIKRQNAAIEFIGKAAIFEKSKEEKLLQQMLKKLDPDDPLRKKIENFMSDNDEDAYLDFIIELNYLIQGQEETELLIKEELKRIESRRKAYNKGIQAWKKAGSPKKTQKEYLARAGVYNDYHSTTTRRKLSGQTSSDVDRATSQIVGTFQGIINNRTHISQLVNIIVDRYGASLFRQTDNDFSFELDERKSIALIQHLTTELHERVLMRLIRKGLNLENLNTLTGSDVTVYDLNELDKIFNDIKNGGLAMSNFLDSISDQYGLGEGKKTYNKSQLTKLTKKTKELYNIAKMTGATKDDEKTWRSKNSLSKANLEKLLDSVLNFTVKLYYQSELNSAKNLRDSVGEAITVGNRGGKTDAYSAGYLVVSVEEPEVRSVQQRLSAEFDRLSPKLKQLRRNYINTGYTKDLQNLNLENQKIYDEWDEAVRKLQSETEARGQKYKEIYDMFSIDTSVKDYVSIGTTSDAFTGGHFGANLSEQVNKIGMLMNKGNLGSSLVDIIWLKAAIMNTKAGLLGDENKAKLEQYLATFMGFLLFDDMTTYIGKGLEGALDSHAQRISLLDLNGTYVPLSYLLSSLYSALHNETESYKSYLNVKINNGYQLHKGNFEGNEQEWYEESEKACQNVDLVVTFMAKFTTLLRDLEQRLAKH